MGTDRERRSQRREACEASATGPTVDAAIARRLLDEVLPAGVQYAAVEAETDPDLRAC